MWRHRIGIVAAGAVAAAALTFAIAAAWLGVTGGFDATTTTFTLPPTTTTTEAVTPEAHTQFDLDVMVADAYCRGWLTAAQLFLAQGVGGMSPVVPTEEQTARAMNGCMEDQLLGKRPPADPGLES